MHYFRTPSSRRQEQKLPSSVQKFTDSHAICPVISSTFLKQKTVDQVTYHGIAAAIFHVLPIQIDSQMCVSVQLASLRKVIEEDQRMYVQWAEEKLSLATIAVDLVQQHRATIDQDISALLAELKVGLGATCCMLPATYLLSISQKISLKCSPLQLVAAHVRSSVFRPGGVVSQVPQPDQRLPPHQKDDFQVNTFGSGYSLVFI